jgi:MinD-like ATPase involved in chromosome partitioning or flagellar assembly
MGELLEAMGEIDPDAKEILKNTLEEFRPKLITNMIRDPKEKEAARMIETVSYKYLGIKTSNLGAIYYDSRIDKSVNQIIRSGTPDLYNESKVLQGSYEIVLQLMKEHK